MTTTEIKLASLVVHLIERSTISGHTFDDHAISSALLDADVAKALNPSALIPATRSGKSALELWPLRIHQ